MEIKNLVPGDHFKMNYGFDQRMFYVLANHNKTVKITMRKWLVSSAITLSHEKVSDGFIYIGRGKWRRWRKLLFFAKDGISAFTKPSCVTTQPANTADRKSCAAN